MKTECLVIDQSLCLSGQAELVGAKNAVLVIMASLLLTRGKSILYNVPRSQDVWSMIVLLENLGAVVFFDEDAHQLIVDTTGVSKYQLTADVMKNMRASILVTGPLLARFGKAQIALPGGCVIGSRPIDFHLKLFAQMGVTLETKGEFIFAQAEKMHARRLVLEYPSVGATENSMMAATLTPGITYIVNAALEPEVGDLIEVLKKMGAKITIQAPATIVIEGVEDLHPIEHAVMYDRLEAGSLLLAAAITGGQIYLPQARAYDMDLFLAKLEEMGHVIEVGKDGIGVRLTATKEPKAVSFKTAPYPGFPTDLQAPMMVAQCLASGTCVVEETVFENRLLHVRELQKMGAQISVEYNKAKITGVSELFGASVIASDIRASCALVLAGLVAKGTTVMSGMRHWRRGYDALEEKMAALGARISVKEFAQEVGIEVPHRTPRVQQDQA